MEPKNANHPVEQLIKSERTSSHDVHFCGKNSAGIAVSHYEQNAYRHRNEYFVLHIPNENGYDSHLKLNDRNLSKEMSFNLDVINEIEDRTSNSSAEESDAENSSNESDYSDEELRSEIDDTKPDNTDMRGKHQCSICLKDFRYLYEFKRHECVPTQLKCYQCNICKKEFSQKSYIRSHEFVHTGEEKLYQCKICMKGFNIKLNLHLHKLLHSREIPFQCFICFKRFTAKASLNKHVLKHYGQKTG